MKKDALTLLPKYNPSPVFIFDEEGECYFRNEPATILLPNISDLSSFGEINVKELIADDSQQVLTYHIKDKYYHINFVGVKSENLLMAYAQEITELIHSVEKEKVAIEAKDDFFRNISHEMRTPLNAIIGLSPVIKKALKNDTKASSIYEMIDENNAKLHKLIEQVLDVQKVKTDTLEVLKTSFHFLPMLENLFEDSKKIATTKNIDFRISVDKSTIPDTLIGDGEKIIKIIESILDNALKFSNSDGIVACKITYIDNILSICVKDNGIGISSENQIKIFTTQQLDGSTTRQYEGSGLGLYLVSKTLNALKGTIRLKSELGKGCEFFIKIPV